MLSSQSYKDNKVVQYAWNCEYNNTNIVHVSIMIYFN
jgi:hypothetical protein